MNTGLQIANPAFCLYGAAASYLYGSRISAGAGTDFTFRTFDGKVDSLSPVMYGYSARLDQMTLLALAGYFLVAWWRNPEFRWNYRWLGVAAALLAKSVGINAICGSPTLPAEAGRSHVWVSQYGARKLGSTSARVVPRKLDRTHLLEGPRGREGGCYG